MHPDHECNCKKLSLLDELMKMSLDDLVGLQQELDKKVEAKRNEAKTKAYNDFVNAYRNFRAICPYDVADVTIDDDDIADGEINLYEYLDFYFDISE